MVGVAGRSKGCKTCRERKIKCDETRPTCIRCQKIGKECPGYNPSIRFIHNVPHAQKQTPLINWEEAPTTTIIEGDKVELVVINGVQKKPKSSRARREAAGKSDALEQKSKPSILRHTPLNASVPLDKTDAYVKVYVQDFVHVSAPYRSAFRTDMVPYRFGHLYATHFRTGDTPETRRSLEDAFASCAATYFAMKEKDITSKIQGHMLYLKLLKSLKNDVKNGLAHSDPAVFLYSCMMAAHYEMLTSVSATTWMYHLSALTSLVQNMGPYAFTDPLAGAILEVVRPYLIFAAIVQCKKCFLEDEQWLTIPVPSYPGGASAWNRILDHATSIPRLFQDGRALLSNITQENAAIHLENCLTVARKFFAWRDEWDMTFGLEPYSWTVPSSDVKDLFTKDEKGPLFDTIIFFDNISICTTIYYFDQMLLVLANHMKRFSPWVDLYLGKYDPVAIKFRQALALFDIGSVCREICRCIDYQRMPEFQYGSTGLFFGAKVAYDIAEPNSRMSRVLEKAMIDSPLMKRVGSTSVNTLLQAWYGPEAPTERDIARVQRQRMGQLYASTLPSSSSSIPVISPSPQALIPSPQVLMPSPSAFEHFAPSPNFMSSTSPQSYASSPPVLIPTPPILASSPIVRMTASADFAEELYFT